MTMKKNKNYIIGNVFKNMFLVQLMTSFIGIAGSVIDGMVTGTFLGLDAMAAFGFTSFITLTVTIVSSILSTGASVVCSKSLGEGNLEKTRHIFSAGFTTVIIISLTLASLIIITAFPIVKFMGAHGELSSLATAYCKGYAIACPGIMLVSFLMPIIQIDGQMRRVLIAVIVMTIGNIILDFVNVIIFHGGMFGMAFATAISYYLALLIMLPHFKNKEAIFTQPSFKPDRTITIKMITVGLPSATSQLGRLLLTFILNWFLMYLGGASAVAAHAVIISAGNLCLVPGTALSSAVQVITGVLYGEEDKEGLSQLMRTVMKYNIFVNGIAMIVFFIFAGQIISMFYDGNPEAIGIAITGFRLFVLCMIFYGNNVCVRSFCLATEQRKKAYAIAISSCFVCPTVFSLMLGYIFGIPALWLYFVLSEGIVMSFVMLTSWYKNIKFTSIKSIIPFPLTLGNNLHVSMLYSITENDLGKVSVLSQEVYKFCMNNNADQRTSFLVSLAVDEVVGNIIEHGFCDGKPHHIDLRLLKKANSWILRIRDDCRLFDMNKYVAQYINDDPTTNIGLKMIQGIATDITYLNTLKLNNLIIKI